MTATGMPRQECVVLAAERRSQDYYEKNMEPIAVAGIRQRGPAIAAFMDDFFRQWGIRWIPGERPMYGFAKGQRAAIGGAPVEDLTSSRKFCVRTDPSVSSSSGPSTSST